MLCRLWKGFRQDRLGDDVKNLEKSEVGLQKIMDGLNATALKYGMKINIKKIKGMRVSREGGEVNITINGTKLEQVKSFKYLGHTITDDGRCETEIKCRIAQAKEAFGNRKELLTKSLKKATKIKIGKNFSVNYTPVRL